VLLDQVCGLLGQLDPATHGCETRQPEVLRRQPFEREEELDGRRTPDDRQAIAVTDQLDLVVHRKLLKRGQGTPRIGAR